MPNIAIRVAHAAVVVCGTAIASGRLCGQTPAVLTATTRHQLVDSISAQVDRIYVDADTGRLIATRLRTQLGAGAYDSLTDPVTLAKQLSADLRSVNHDLHLSVNYGASGGPTRNAALDFLGRPNHYALGRVEVLPGNIGYFEINGFSSDQGARDAIDGALQYLQTTDAVIIDLRKNRGGDGNTVNYLISHFTGADTIASVTVKTRNGRAFTRYTLPSVAGPRRSDVPLYVLTSRSTGSAGEDCAFVLKNIGRATVIGDRTAGAGHNVTFVPSGFGFMTGISFSRVSDPRTGKEWEQIGVQPDVKVDPSTALDEAQSLASKAIAQKATRP